MNGRGSVILICRFENENEPITVPDPCHNEVVSRQLMVNYIEKLYNNKESYCDCNQQPCYLTS